LSETHNHEKVVSRRTSNFYHGRRAVLATMHGKEAVISPAFRKRLGLRVETPKGLDTDALGTFTGEIARIGTIRETSIAKARLGMTTMGISIGIASEGATGRIRTFPSLLAALSLWLLWTMTGELSCASI